MAKIESICLIVKEGRELLMALKQEGRGAGNLNAPGGKLEEGESLENSVAREVMEEFAVRVDPSKLEKVAIIHFYFGETPGPEVHVFLTGEWSGQPRESKEMGNPTWYEISDLPWDKMWLADRDWMPVVFSGEKIHWSIQYSANFNSVLRIVKHDLNF